MIAWLDVSNVIKKTALWNRTAFRLDSVTCLKGDYTMTDAKWWWGEGEYGSVFFDKLVLEEHHRLRGPFDTKREAIEAYLLGLPLDDENPTEPFTSVEDPDTIIFRGEGE